MKAENYSKYRTKEEIAHDEARNNHVSGLCDWQTCEWCQGEEIEWMINEHEEDMKRRCPTCGSTDFTRDGTTERCATCGR